MKDVVILDYIRVSTEEQNESRQMEGLENSEELIFIDKESGKDFNRPEFERMMILARTVKSTGSRVAIRVKELDRLSRNLNDIKNFYEECKNEGIEIIVRDLDILSTYNKSDVEKELVAPIVIHLLGYMAEKEREKIKQRQREGINQMEVCKNSGKKISKKTGKATGRPTIDLTKDQKRDIKKWFSGNINATQCSKLTDINRVQLYRIKKEPKKYGI